jgi:hypothetical protein
METREYKFKLDFATTNQKQKRVRFGLKVNLWHQLHMNFDTS